MSKRIKNQNSYFPRNRVMRLYELCVLETGGVTSIIEIFVRESEISETVESKTPNWQKIDYITPYPQVDDRGIIRKLQGSIIRER